MKLPEILRERLRADDPPTLCVAFSGGPDSTALLHALAHTPEARARGLRALHVDHGLHADSAAWAEHCATFCKTVDVPLTTVRVEVGDSRGEGIEAAARRARYAAFAEQLHAGEWLALAHHRDDQVETVLLKLLRGAGPEGLGGMRLLRPFAHGFLWRPLLETPREMVRKYLTEHEITCVDDPANYDGRFARNVLRTEIMPRIARHWPHAEASILHTAQLCRAAADYIDDDARAALENLRRGTGTLDVAGWLELPDALRAPVLDAWLHARGLDHPPDASRAELERQTTGAARDSVPVLAWANTEIRIWNGRLHAMPPLAAPPERWQSQWNGATLVLPPDCGALSLEPATGNSSPTNGARFDPPLAVCFRHGGERIRPSGDPHTRELRDLFQQARIPPWLRARCPLIHENNELIAVADLWSSARGGAIFAACGAGPRWERPAWMNTA
ncbi:MAG TPA: tRNA lysidine(34) synthetase TilS [Rhodanobacteraceae bacterium]|nr:tRNA lysidine(34) synthetase TilS [Rhodanobacteraceae bacterium]